MVNFTCNATLDDMRIVSETPIVGALNFHELGFIISAGCALVAVLLSFYLIFMHALHYTKPYEQRHIIRILFMIPVYAVSALLSFMFYWHAIYFQVISDCYEAFAIASFFALLCNYTAPNLHDQKDYFRTITPQRWVWPLPWFAKCCGGERGIWRTPRSGLTWFNVIWFGIYQYCFIRVAATITAVVTQYFEKYCESSNEPWFAHIWVLVIEALAVTVAMYCVIQFYVQLRHDLARHSPFLKVLAIKLVIFLSFWQTFMISIFTSTFPIITASDALAYPDIAVGIPSMLLCFEMATFAVIHIFAYPYKPYLDGAQGGKYPVTSDDATDHGDNVIGPNKGGFLGWRAIADAMNPWDLVKAFARGMRWIFVGRKTRDVDAAYKVNSNDMAMENRGDTEYKGARDDSQLPIANQFRRSKFGMPLEADEGVGLIEHAQPNPHRTGAYTPARDRYDVTTGQEISSASKVYDGSPERSNGPYPRSALRADADIGVASSTYDDPNLGRGQWSQAYTADSARTQRPAGGESRPTQSATHNMLWGNGAEQQQPQRNKYDEQI